MKRFFSRLFFLAAAADLTLIAFLIVRGFPIDASWLHFSIKNLRKPSFIFIALTLAGWVLRPNFWQATLDFSARFSRWASTRAAAWALFSFFALLFVWQQLTEYWALKINFIPFMFYEYMLYYFVHDGLFNFTNLLHLFYHVNTALLFFVPLWKLVRDPILLVVLEGVIAAAAVFPLVAFAKQKFPQGSAWPWLIGWIYLNYRYLYHLLEMNFGIEIFYPLFFFGLFWAFFAERWLYYYLFAVLILLVKEDAAIYLGGFGAAAILWPGKRRHGLATLAVAVAGFFLTAYWFIPKTGSTIWESSMANFKSSGADEHALITAWLQKPFVILKSMVDDPQKIETIFTLLYTLVFLPILTPAFLMLFFPLFPLFMHFTGRDSDFYSLNFHYAGAVLPFIFFAFVLGTSNFVRWMQPVKWRRPVFAVLIIALLLINGGTYRTQHWTQGNLESIRWARAVPEGNLVTHGHLLPYAGHRQYNYYLAGPWERKKHIYHQLYQNADYYLLDTSVDPYPMDQAFVEKRIAELRERSEYTLARSDGTRFLFVRNEKMPKTALPK